MPAESPLAPETNPPGDIPDTQTFIAYSDPSGYTLEVPEGWSRSTNANTVLFVSKFDGVSVTLKPAAAAPSLASVQQTEIPALAQGERAFQPGKVDLLQLPGGQAVHIMATANSDPDPVTSKQVRLEEQFYLFYHNGQLVILKVWAPLGADNVDQWKHMSESFGWK